MGNGLLPEEHGNNGIGPQRTKRPGNRFEPYEAGHVPGQRPLGVSNLGLETPQLPGQSEPNSKTPSEPYDIDEGYDSDQVEAYDVAWHQKAAATAEASDYAKWEPAAAEFIKSYSGLGNGWVGKRPLGAGGFGMVRTFWSISFLYSAISELQDICPEQKALPRPRPVLRV